MEKLLTVIAIILLMIGNLFLVGWLFMLLANWTLSLFSIAFTFTFWQAFSVILLLSFVINIIKKVWKHY